MPMPHISSISCSNIVSLYDDHEKKHIWTPTKKVRGRPYMRSGDVPAEGPPEFFLCPGLAFPFSLVRAMSVDHSYRFLKMLTILEHFTILYTCDKVGKILKFRRSEMQAKFWNCSHLICIGGPQKKILWQTWSFGPTRGGVWPKTNFFVKLSKQN